MTPSNDAAHWLRQHLAIPCPSPQQIGEEAGRQDRDAGKPDSYLLAEFGFSDPEMAQALEGWRRGYGLADEMDRSGPVRVDARAERR